jgi:hypothetical protein
MRLRTLSCERARTNQVRNLVVISVVRRGDLLRCSHIAAVRDTVSVRYTIFFFFIRYLYRRAHKCVLIRYSIWSTGRENIVPERLSA